LTRNDLNHATRCLAAGGIIAYPSEFCFGLGCDPRDHRAVRRLLALKQRPWSKGLILIADHIDRLLPWLEPLPAPLRERLQHLWPGPHTLLLPAPRRVSRWLRGRFETLAVRVTAHPGAAALCRSARGPLVSTSANRSGRPPLRSAGQVRREFGDGVDLVLAGRCGGLQRPTEIRHGITGELVRAGAVT
jgi:L-threonylcarbamoyladenylate synthase